MTIPTLDEIACRLGTDKSTLTTLPTGHNGFPGSRGSGHAYTVFYEEFFRRRRDEPVRLLEIGVLDGRSLAMWAEYFSAGHIHGLDLDPSCRQFERDRTRVFIGSQDDPAVLASVKAAVPEGFDIVIDDGSHYVKHMIASFHGLFEHVTPGGYYVIEDISTAGVLNWGSESFNRGMALLQDARGNDPSEMTQFLRDIKARPDVAELVLHQRAICFIRKRAAGDPASTLYERGGKIEDLFPLPRPLWRRAAGRFVHWATGRFAYCASFFR